MSLTESDTCMLLALKLKEKRKQKIPTTKTDDKQYVAYVNDEHIEPTTPEFIHQSITPAYSLPIHSSYITLASHNPSELSQFFPQSNAPKDISIDDASLANIPYIDLEHMSDEVKNTYDEGRKKAASNIVHKDNVDELEVRPKSPGADMDMSQYIDPNVGVHKPTFSVDMVHALNGGKQDQIQAMLTLAKDTEKLEKDRYDKYASNNENSLIKETKDILRWNRNPLKKVKEPPAGRRISNEPSGNG